MKNKQNHNTVKVEIPIIGEYILVILDHMLIVKCIADQTYQYSEFTYIENKYIMTSVNCRSGNVMRIMEEFCKSYNCPKRILREEIEKAEKSVKKSNVIDSETYEEIISTYENSIKTYNEVISGYANAILDIESKFNLYNIF